MRHGVMTRQLRHAHSGQAIRGRGAHGLHGVAASAVCQYEGAATHQPARPVLKEERLSKVAYR